MTARRTATFALAAFAGLSFASCGGRTFPDERAVCEALSDLLDARARNDDRAAGAAEDRLRDAALRTQNIHLAWFGQAYTGVEGSQPRPDALARLRGECDQIGLPVDA